MFAKTLVLLSCVLSFVNADFDYTVNNTNFTISQNGAGDDYLYNYDRLRFSSDFTDENLFAKIIADGVNYYGEKFTNSQLFIPLQTFQADVPFDTQTKFHNYDSGAGYMKLYRLYGGYEDGENRLVLGLQNISMGVGRIWTPTNIFNPRNIYTLEPDEIFGVLGLSYTRYINETSNIMGVVSQKADQTYKYALRYKGYMEYADVGLSSVYYKKTKILGFELEGDLKDTGVELRAEGAYIDAKLRTSMSQVDDKQFAQLMLGCDYGFVNGITLVAETFLSTERFSFDEIVLNYDSELLQNLVYSKVSTAVSLSYGFNIFLDASLAYIQSFDEEYSHFIAPSVNYTLNDFNSFSVGAMIENGFMKRQSYFLRWSLSF